MQFKSITAIIVLLLVVASLLVSGCTTSTTSNTNQTPSASTATHDAFLEKFLSAFNDTQYSNKSRQIKAYELEWINSTSARLQYTFVWKPSNYTNYTTAYDTTYTVFPTSQDATNYVNAINKTNYSLASTVYTDWAGGLAYKNATGHAPQSFKAYQQNVGFSESKVIVLVDNIVYEYTAKTLS
jgi:hypothetical protein